MHARRLIMRQGFDSESIHKRCEKFYYYPRIGKVARERVLMNQGKLLWVSQRGNPGASVILWATGGFLPDGEEWMDEIRSSRPGPHERRPAARSDICSLVLFVYLSLLFLPQALHVPHRRLVSRPLLVKPLCVVDFQSILIFLWLYQHLVLRSGNLIISGQLYMHDKWQVYDKGFKLFCGKMNTKKSLELCP